MSLKLKEDKDSRLEELLGLIMQLANGNLEARVTPTELGDEIDAIIIGLNMLAEEISASTVSKEYVERIIHSMNEGLIVISPEGTIQTVNDALCAMSGYEEEELVGKYILKIFDRERIVKDDRLQKLFKDGSVRNYDETCLTKSGEQIPVSFSGSAMRDKDGNMEGFIGIARDMREIRGLVRQLEEKAQELEKSNQDLQKATAQLVQSEKLSALGELTAGVAHELNQPLNGIKIICQSLLRDMEKNRFEQEEVGNDLTEIVGQVNKMAEIIDHMRIYSRRSQEGYREMIDIRSLIEGPFKLLDQQLRNHNIEVVKELDPDLPKIVGDPIRLEQVFMNLITNARNALDRNGKENKRMEVRTYRDRDHGPGAGSGAVVVEVKDNGEGIPDHLKNKVFQPFFTTREPGQGTGLGLSVASKIVEEHFGKIELESATGEGTTFRVILPAANEAAA